MGREKLMSKPIVVVKNVVKSYRKGREAVEVLHGLDLEIDDGEFSLKWA